MKNLILIILLIPVIAAAKDRCESEWEKIYDGSDSFSNEELLADWQDVKKNCLDSWVHPYREGYLLFSLGRFDEAESIARKAKGNFSDRSPFEFLLLLVKKYESAESDGILSKDSLNELDKSLDAMKGKVIANYPEYQSELALSKLALGKVDEAIAHANIGLKLGEDWPLLRTLALAYEASGNYILVRQSIDRLATLSQDTYLKSTELLLLSARAYAATGRMDLAKLAIVQASELAPQSMEDPEIKRTVQFIRAKIVSGEFKNP